MIRETLWKLFPPYEVAALKNKLIEFIDQTPESDLANDFVMIELGSSLVKDTALDFIKNNQGKVVDAIRIQHMSVEQTTLNLIILSCQPHLKSGRNHFYRGSLNNSGKRVLELFDNALNISVTKGFMEKQKAENARFSLLRSIAEAG